MGEQNEGKPSGGAATLRDRIAELEASESACRRDVQALRDVAARFRSLVEVTSDWVWEIDESRRYTYSNPRVRDLLGYEPEEVLGRTPFDLMPPDEARRLEATFAAAAERREPFHLLENTNRHKDGHLVVLETSAVPVFDEQGRFRGYRGMDRDITARKRAEERLSESEARCRDLIGVASDIVWEADANGNFTYVTPQMRDLLGYEAEELLGKPFLDLLPPEDRPRIAAMWREVQESPQPYRFVESRNVRKDGTVIDVETSAVPVLDARGRFAGVRAAGHEITTRKRAEERLRQSEARFRDLVEVTSDFVYEIDPDGIYTYVGPRVRDILGYEPEELLGKSILDLLPPEDVPRFEALYRSILEERRPVRFLENRNVRKDGTLVYLESSAVPFYDSQGRLVGYRGIDRDISRRKQDEEQLRQSEQRLRDLVEASSDIVWEADTKGNFTFVSPRVREILGYEPSERVGRNVLELLVPEDRARIAPIYQAALQHPQPLRSLEYEIVRKDGTIAYLESSIVPFFDAEGRLAGYRGLDRDITSRKQADEQLRQSEQRLQDLVSVTSDLVWETDAWGAITYLGPREREILGYEPQERLGRSVLDLVTPERRAEIGTLIRAAYEQARPLRFVEIGVARRDGTQVYLEASAVPFYDARGRLAGYRGLARDITARKQAEEERERLVAEAQRRAAELLAVLDSMVDTVLVADATGRITLANKAALKLMHLPSTQDGSLGSMQKVAAALMVRDLRGRRVEPEQFPLGRALRGETVAQEDLVSTDPTSGRESYYRISAAPIRSSTGQIVGGVSVIRDVTELVELDKLKDQFVTVAAHELKTPVTVMKGYAQALLREDRQMPEARRRMLSAIDRGADRIDRIVKDLVDISRLQLGGLALAAGRVDLRELAQEAVRVMGATTARHRIRLRAEPAIVLGDRERLGQVLRSLLDNAIKYSPGGGDIDVDVAVQAGQAVVSVQDHGIGIPKNRQARVFERFYRAHAGTPYDYGGMGVGLYIAWEIVTRLKGRIWFESQEGKGSTFHFSLPLAG